LKPPVSNAQKSPNSPSSKLDPKIGLVGVIDRKFAKKKVASHLHFPYFSIIKSWSIQNPNCLAIASPLVHAIGCLGFPQNLQKSPSHRRPGTS
jgi:hypothetical protein